MSKPWKDTWPWEPSFRATWYLGAAGISLMFVALAWPQFGVGALWWLLVALAGPFMAGVYGAVGSRVAALEQHFAGDPGEVVQTLLVIGTLQSPGVAVLRESELTLAAITGREITVPLGGIENVQESGRLPGKGLIGKRAFLFSAPEEKRLAFAVTRDVARRWGPRLTRG